VANTSLMPSSTLFKAKLLTGFWHRSELRFSLLSHKRATQATSFDLLIPNTELAIPTPLSCRKSSIPASLEPTSKLTKPPSKLSSTHSLVTTTRTPSRCLRLLSSLIASLWSTVNDFQRSVTIISASKCGNILMASTSRINFPLLHQSRRLPHPISLPESLPINPPICSVATAEPLVILLMNVVSD